MGLADFAGIVEIPTLAPAGATATRTLDELQQAITTCNPTHVERRADRLSFQVNGQSWFWSGNRERNRELMPGRYLFRIVFKGEDVYLTYSVRLRYILMSAALATVVPLLTLRKVDTEAFVKVIFWFGSVWSLHYVIVRYAAFLFRRFLNRELLDRLRITWHGGSR